MANYAQPENSRTRVERAGTLIIQTTPGDLTRFAERDTALNIISNWRAAHAYPLNSILMTLRQRARKFPGTIFAQRQKRLRSIEAKLRRQPSMKLSRMQDLGGCRAVLETVEGLQELDRDYAEGRSRLRANFERRRDYVTDPKEDGYRSIHYVYKYNARKKEHEIYNGMRIEIQLRSALQHAWATALETVATFKGMPLKWGGGDPRWLRFFQLMGSAMAISEDSPTVPGTSENLLDLIKEIRDLSRELTVQDFLAGLARSLQNLPKEGRRGTQYILILNIETHEFYWIRYSAAQRAAAAESYARLEREIQDKPHIDAVLVSVDSVKELRKAYPNYYADTSYFVDYLNDVLTVD